METAWLEAQQGFPFKAQPMTLVAYEVDCEDVEDLTDAAVMAKLGVSRSDLACPWEDLASRGETPPSWNLSERLRASGTAGIVVPSFASGAGPDDINVVFWSWSDARPHKVKVIDDFSRLPRDRASWC
jgi:RES domain-containing protein